MRQSILLFSCHSGVPRGVEWFAQVALSFQEADGLKGSATVASLMNCDAGSFPEAPCFEDGRSNSIATVIQMDF